MSQSIGKCRGTSYKSMKYKGPLRRKEERKRVGEGIYSKQVGKMYDICSNKGKLKGDQKVPYLKWYFSAIGFQGKRERACCVPLNLSLCITVE